MLFRRLCRFSLTKEQLEYLLNVGKWTRISDKENEERAKEVFREVSQKLDQYLPEAQIKFLRLFSHFGLRDDYMLGKVEQQLSKGLKKLNMTQKLTLIRALHKYHGRYIPYKPIFTSLNTNLLSPGPLKTEEIFKLFILFDKLKWSSKAFNNLVYYCVSREQFGLFKFEYLVKIGIIIAEQNFTNLKNLSIVLEKIDSSLQYTSFSKLNNQTIAYVYYLLYGNLLMDRVYTIYNTLKTKSELSSVLGYSSFMGDIDKEKQQVLYVIEKIQKNRDAYEEKLKKITDFEPSYIVLMSDTKNPELIEKFKNIYINKMMKMKPIYFAKLARKYGISEDFFKFYDHYFYLTNINEKLFLLNSAYEWVDKEELKKKVYTLISTKEDIDSKRFVRLYDLARATNVNYYKIVGYIEKLAQYYPYDKTV